MLRRIAWSPVLRRAALAAVVAVSATAAVAAVVAGTGWGRWLLGSVVAVLGLGAAVLLRHVFALTVDAGLLLDRLAALEPLTSESAALAGRVDHLAASTQAAVATHDAALSRVAADAAERAAASVARLDELEAAVTGQHAALHDVRGQLTESLDEIASSRKEAVAARDEARDRAVALGRELQVARGETYQQLGRLLTEAGRRTLLAEWPERLGVEIGAARLAYLERKLVDVEARCRGRMAAGADDAALRALVASALRTARPRVLEIGVLFAVNAVYLHDVAGFLYDDFHQTLIDPFFGYYGNQEPDPYTGVLVSEAVARDNLRVGGVPPDAYEIVVGLSTDDAVRARVGRNRYDAVLIDGDHSYDGVAADFEWSAELLAPGGYLMIDDYRGPSWPDVTRFVDEVVVADRRFEMVGSFARTAVFRRR